jgi:hypothetical protein
MKISVDKKNLVIKIPVKKLMDMLVGSTPAEVIEEIKRYDKPAEVTGDNPVAPALGPEASPSVQQ